MTIGMSLSSSDMSPSCVHQDRFLAFPPQQHPIVLQLGGSNVESLAKAAKLSHAYGYDEINLKLVSFSLCIAYGVKKLKLCLFSFLLR